MFDDLISLLGGWYADYVEMIRDLLQTSVETITVIPTASGDPITEITTNYVNPAIWSAYVPWEHVIAATTLIVFTVCIFKLIRSLLCKIL